jgi:hypothetical protein
VAGGLLVVEVVARLPRLVAGCARLLVVARRALRLLAWRLAVL